MHTSTQGEELVIWTAPQALDEAKSLFAPYAPKFQTIPGSDRTVLAKHGVNVLYLSQPAEDSVIENTLAQLRDSKVSTLFFYVPHHSADFAFRVGTMVGRKKFPEAEWAFNWPHLRQLLKARNIRISSRPHGPDNGFDILAARRRLGLSQKQMAKSLNVTTRTLQNWEAGKGTGQMEKKTKDLRDLLSRMDDYVVASREKEWLGWPLEAFGRRAPRQLLAEGRLRDLVIEFDRLQEGQPV